MPVTTVTVLIHPTVCLIKAAEKFKYKPKVIDGNPVATAGVQNKITFELVED